MLLLDINDTEITLLRDGETLYCEPGVAFVDRRNVIFGHAALAQARLHPRQSHNEFWQRLNADPVTPGGRGVGNQADLVYLHLQTVRKTIRMARRAPVVVAAPAAVTQQQMAVLLGIAAEAGFEVQAFVDASVAAAARQPLAGPCRVVDVTLHRGIVTHLQVGAGQVQRGTVQEVAAAGLAALTEGWVDAVADRFVESSRFDPLRIAQTEQQVFDQVAAGIEAEQVDFAIDVRHDDVSRQVHVPRQALADKSEQRYAVLARAIGAPTALAITARTRRLPGLAAYLQAAGHDILPLPDDAVATAAATHADLIVPAQAADGARLIASLPLHDAAHAPSAPAAAPPTHLLCGAVALPLGAQTNAHEHPSCPGGAPMFHIRCDEHGVVVAPDDHAAVFLNDARIDFEHPLAAGDTLTCGSVTFQLITILDRSAQGVAGAVGA